MTPLPSITPPDTTSSSGMKINGITTLAGPNVHLHHPVLVATLETGDNLSINDVPRLIERLSESLPELASSTPSDVASLVADVTRALMRRVEIAVDDPGPSRGAALQPVCRGGPSGS